MPALCRNRLTLYGPPDLLKELAETGLSLERLVPCPKGMEDAAQKNVTPSLSDLKRRKKLADRYGFWTTQEWATTRWGTKADFGPLSNLRVEGPKGQDAHYELHAEFDSVWGPPVKALETLYERHKAESLEVWLEYHEPECQFLGTVTTRAGEFVDDQRGYDDAEELESVCEELDHELGRLGLQYFRALESGMVGETAPAKPAPKSKAAPKAKPAPKPPASSRPSAPDKRLDLLRLKLDDMLKPKGQRPPAPKSTAKKVPTAEVPAKAAPKAARRKSPSEE